MGTNIKRLQPSELYARTVPGKPMFSQAVVVEIGKRIVFVSGQVSQDGQGNVVGKDDMRAQFVQVVDNVRACLAGAGANLSDVVKMTTFVTDMVEYAKMRELRVKYFGDAAPASSGIEVSKLAHPDYLIEMEAIAMLD